MQKKGNKEKFILLTLIYQGRWGYESYRLPLYSSLSFPAIFYFLFYFVLLQ